MPEEEPVPSGRARRVALLQKGAERRDTGSRAHHDYRRVWIGGQTEIVRLLDVGFQRVAGRGALSEIGRGETETFALADDIADRIDGEREAARRRLL
jgi:hypothetical protein